jgi:pyruvate,water dikinase
VSTSTDEVTAGRGASHPAPAVPLADADDEQRFGGKAAALGQARRAGLPVPDGVALPADLVAAVVAADPDAIRQVAAALPAGPLAVRSSAIGEDGPAGSFAGQHLSLLNVEGLERVVEAIVAVAASAAGAAARAYRQRTGVGDGTACGVVLQHLFPAAVAGVLFTRDPVSGRDERVIEASWHLGESVVGGLVTPDRYRLGRDGVIRQVVVGHKDVAVVPLEGGGTATRPVTPDQARLRCLSDAQLAALGELAERCEREFTGEHDLEWAIGADRWGQDQLVLLQRRPITA